VAGGVQDVLARADHAVVVIALPHLHELRPRLVVLELLARRLREELVADAQGQLPLPAEPGPRAVPVGEALHPPARVDHARDAEAVMLAHAAACGADLP